MARAERRRGARDALQRGRGSPRVTFLPAGITTIVPPRTTVYDAAAWIGQPLDSACGGRGTCGQCRVRVRRGPPSGPTPADLQHIGAAQRAKGWRISCRLEVRSAMTVEVPRLLRAAQSVPLAAGRQVPLTPNVRKVHLRLPRPRLGDQRSDLRRLEEALAASGFAVSADLAVLRTLPAALRQEDFDVTAVLCGAELVAVEPGDTSRDAHGVAIDLGTTTVVGTLVDLNTGASCDVVSTPNAQAVHGADVLSRVSHAMSGTDGLSDLQRLAVGAVNEVIVGLARQAGVGADRVYEVAVAGNVIMIQLLLGIDPGPIAATPFTPAFTRGLSPPARSIGVAIHPRGKVYVLPALGAYAGSDIVAGLLATGLPRDSRLRLLVDVGTNGEIALGSQRRTLVTAAPAGPAFEGAEISCGMRATTGAIERIDIGADEVLLRTIGDASPKGLCGSGVVDAVAQLYRRGLLDASGRFLRSSEVKQRAPGSIHDRLVTIDGARAFVVATAGQTGSAPVLLTQKDVRQLQSAKGSIAAGIRVLMNEMGVGPGDLDEVLLAGSFGSYIRPDSARTVGLVPPVPLDRIRVAGNAAGEGARIALLSYPERQAAEAMPARVEYLELSARPEFDELFLQGLRFPPGGGAG